MSTGGGPGRPAEPVELRIGDAEREEAVAALGDHYASGRLSKEEYDERSAQAYAARSRSAVLPLFADLPSGAGSTPGPAPGSHPGTPWVGDAGHGTDRSAGRSAAGRAGRRGSGRQRHPHGPGWPVGLLVPVLLVLVGLTVLTHAPFFLIGVLGWIVLARTGHRWGHCSRIRH